MKGKSEFKKKIIADKLEAEQKAREAAAAKKAAEAAKFQEILDMSYNARHSLIEAVIETINFNPYTNRAIKPLRKALEEKYFDIVDVKVYNGAFCTTELNINIWIWDGNSDSDMTEHHVFNFG